MILLFLQKTQSYELRLNWNADDADWADFRGFFLFFTDLKPYYQKSALIRRIRVILVSIVSKSALSKMKSLQK
jgi:hypothetical protein